MKTRSIRYLTGEGVKSIWVNRLMSVASVGVLVACMLLIGVAIALTVNVDKALGNLEQQNVVMVYFQDAAAAEYDTPASQAATSDSSSGSSSSSSGSSSSSSSSSSSKSSSSGSSSASSSSKTTSGSSEEEETLDPSILSQEECRALCDVIAGMNNVASVEFIPSEEGLQRMLDTMDPTQAQYFSWLEEDNPLSNAAKVTMTDLSQFDATVSAIEAIDGVENVYHQRDLAIKITSIKNGITVAGFWIIALLMVISLVIVSNTIRVTMYNRKLEISIMKAVGATNAFIRFPFVVEGIAIGLISACLTTGILYFVYNAVVGSMMTALGLTSAVAFRSFVWKVFGLFCGIGVFAGLFSSFFTISKYLRKEGSEFKAL